MFGVLWNTLLVNPIFNVLVALYQLTDNLGVSIILLTILIKTLLIPIVLPSIKSMKLQRDLQPEIEKIREKFKHDKRLQAEKQMELFNKHGMNPATGCVTQILTLLPVFALFGVINQFSRNISIETINNLLYFNSLKLMPGETLHTHFGFWDLTKPDPYYFLAVLSGALQFLSSKMMMPFTTAAEKAAKKTPDKRDDMAYNMQEQMLYMMPIMTVVISLKLPAGVVLYILVTTIFSLVQQYFVSGPGGLKPLFEKLGLKS